ncbi:MAG: hypothetical protein MJH10_11920 [Epibacterium sp.]|nr:hypothetical protein [Epibacterium sp.]NQX74254.1 J domain-containing protein [Epibacterium sp.]
MNYFQNCTTLDEAKKLYYELAKELHPDRGGNTAAFQDLSNQFEKFDPSELKFSSEKEEWNAKEYAHIVEALMKIPGITIEICGSWIWLTGDTRPVKDQIKGIETGASYKRGFSKSKVAWYFSPRGYRKRSKRELDLDQIREHYGSQKMNSSGNALKAA